MSNLNTEHVKIVKYSRFLIDFYSNFQVFFLNFKIPGSFRLFGLDCQIPGFLSTLKKSSSLKELIIK